MDGYKGGMIKRATVIRIALGESVGLEPRKRSSLFQIKHASWTCLAIEQRQQSYYRTALSTLLSSDLIQHPENLCVEMWLGTLTNSGTRGLVGRI